MHLDPPLTCPDALTVRLTVAGRKMPMPEVARRALRVATDLIAYAVGDALARLRSTADPLMTAQGTIQQQTTLLNAHQEIASLLAERWDKIPDARRPRYTASQRLRIVRIKRLMGLSPEETARTFRLSAGTVYRWQADLGRPPKHPSRRPLVDGSPPIRRYQDQVRETVHALALAGFGGYQKIADTLARAGWKISASTVARYVKRAHGGPGRPSPQQRFARTVCAKYAHHVWMMDLTHITGLFGFMSFKVAAILDVFSRFPIAVRVFTKEPSAGDVLDVMEIAMRRHGRPRHLVTDQGPQFTDELFRDTIHALGIKQRFGAIGKHGSIAIIERCFRSLRESLGLPLWKPLLRADLEGRLEPALVHYAFHRPHQGLGGATPAEVLLDIEPAHLKAIQPPRGQPGQRSDTVRLTIEHVDDAGRFPVLRRAA
jgi:transposase InsO family protein